MAGYKTKTEADFILEDNLALKRAEMDLEIKSYRRRRNYKITKETIDAHNLAIQAEGPKPLELKPKTRRSNG